MSKKFIKGLILVMTMVVLCLAVAVSAGAYNDCSHNRDGEDLWMIADDNYNCTVGGETLYRCGECHKTKNVYIEPKEHDLYVSESWDALCIYSGGIIYSCKNCSFRVEETLPATGEHIYYAESFKDATCTEPGYTVYNCFACGEAEYIEYDKTDPALGHDYSGEWTELLPATCYDRGVKINQCTRCSVIASEVIDRTTHTDADADAICDDCSTLLSTTVTPDTPDTPDEPDAPTESEQPEKEANIFSFLTEFLTKLIDFFSKLFKLN